MVSEKTHDGAEIVSKSFMARFACCSFGPGPAERRHPCRRVAFSMLRGVNKVRAGKDVGAPRQEPPNRYNVRIPGAVPAPSQNSAGLPHSTTGLTTGLTMLRSIRIVGASEEYDDET